MPGSNSNTSFIAPVQTDNAYPARVGEPSVDGPIIYPEPQPGEKSNVVPFQRDTGIDPSKIPSLSDITRKTLEKPSLKVLAGGVNTGVANQPIVAAQNPAGPATTAQVLLAEAPADESKKTLPWWGIALAVVGAVAIGYAMAPKGNEPLVAGLDDEEDDDSNDDDEE